MRQAGRYMPEYRAIRKQHSLLEIARSPRSQPKLPSLPPNFSASMPPSIFADLLLPLEVMGLPFHFSAGEARSSRSRPHRRRHRPTPHRPRRRTRLRRRSGESVAKHFAGKIPVIGFCGAPFTLAAT